MNSNKQLMLVVAELVSFVSWRFSQPQSLLKDVECTDMHSGFGGKMFKWLIIRSRSSWSASLFLLCPHSSNTEVLTVWWNFADSGGGGGGGVVVTIPYIAFQSLNRTPWLPQLLWDRGHSLFMTWSLMSLRFLAKEYFRWLAPSVCKFE